MAETGRKQLEQLMHQLQEQLQINLLQQTHMMQATAASSDNLKSSGGGKSASSSATAALQQLQMQQQQLISQLQLVQQRVLMVRENESVVQLLQLLTNIFNFLPSLLQLPNFHSRPGSKDDELRSGHWKENGNSTPSPKLSQKSK